MHGYAKTLALGALLLALAAGGGCAARSAPQPAPEPMRLTPGAQLTYDYLYALDQRTRLMALTQSDPQPGSAEYDQALILQSRSADALDRVLAQSPTAMLYGEKASLYFNREQINTALLILHRGLDLYPDDRVLLSLLTNAYLVKQDQDMAAATLEEYILIHPEDQEARVRLVTILVEAKKYARALDQIEQIDPKDRDDAVNYLKGRSQSRIGQRTEAIRTLKAILRHNPDHYEALAELAYIHEVTAQFERAVQTYARLLELGGPASEIGQRLITLNLKLNRVDEALKAALEGPDTRNFLLQAAGIFLNENFPAQASAVLDRLGAQRPVPPEYYFYKAVIAYDAEEDPEKALTFLDQVPESSANHAQAQVFRIQILADLGRDTESRVILDQALKRYPDDLRFDRMLAEYLILDEEHEKAAEVLRRAMDKHGDNPELLFQYGALLDLMGRRGEAIATMERIVENDPQNAEALNFIGYTLAEENRDLERALVLVENAMKQKPESGAITDSLAWVLFKQGKLDQAWEHIQRAVQLMDNDAVIWEHYGDIAAAKKLRKAARSGYRKALNLNPKDADAIQAKLDRL